MPRIYLLTRKQDHESEEDHSEDDFLTPTLENKAASPPTTLSRDESDGLIGTSKERQEYLEDLEKTLKASLEADKEKEKVKEERKANLDAEVRTAKEQAERLERLRLSRELLCPLEPSGNDPRVMVCVRHNILGVVTRAFDPNGTISGIYDWVGSLSPTPEHFRLTTFPCSTLYPEDRIVTVKNTIINMTAAEEPIPLSREDNDVHFLDGRGFEGAMDETLLDVEEDIIQLSPSPDNPQSSSEVEPVYNSPPVQLLQGESNSDSDTIQSLEDKRMKHVYSLLPARIVLLDRHDVVKELLALYKDDGILCTKLSLSFVDETALGDGVLREVFSTFWDCFLARFCEGNMQFVFVPRSSLTDEDYVAVGRIITHQFVLTGTFPVQVAEAQIFQAMFGQVSEDCLVSSFLQLLPERERQILCEAQEKDGPFPTDAIVDILSEYNVTSIPTAKSLPQIIKQVSRSEVIHKPFFLLQKIRQGMGNFWIDITKGEMEEIYRQTTPNAANVTESLDCVTWDNKEEQVAGWLVQYLKAADSKMLCRFLRFCTASDMVLPKKRIAVRFENMSEAAMRPKAMTCFCSLLLRKGYNSFAHFSTNLDFYLTNTTFWDLMD